MKNNEIKNTIVSISPRKMYKICKKYEIRENSNVDKSIKKVKKSYIIAKPFQIMDKRFPKRGSLQEDLTLSPNLFLEAEEYKGSPSVNQDEQKISIKNWNNLKFPNNKNKLSNKKLKIKLGNAKGNFQTKMDIFDNKKKTSSVIEISKEMAEKKFKETLNRLSSTQQSFLQSNENFSSVISAREERIFKKYRTYKAQWQKQDKNYNETQKFHKHNSVMDRADYFREKKELLFAFEHATETGEVKELSKWKSSLRRYNDDNTNEQLYVATGVKNNPIWMRILEGDNDVINQKIRFPNSKHPPRIKSYKDSQYFKDKEKKAKELLNKISPCRMAEMNGLELKGSSQIEKEYNAIKNMKEPLELENPSLNEIEDPLDEEIIAFHYDIKNKI